MTTCAAACSLSSRLLLPTTRLLPWTSSTHTVDSLISVLSLLLQNSPFIARYKTHGGDGHGDPPPGGWNPASGCAASGPKKRGKTKNKKLLAIWEGNGFNPLEIFFDFNDHGTMRPVGNYAKHFKALLGVTLRQTVPLTYDAWDNVPRDMRTAIYPQLQTYFNIGDYIGPTGVFDTFERGINRLCASMYSTAKYHFKKKHFTKLGGYDNVQNIRQIVPPNLDAQAWSDLIDFYIREDNVHRSRVNSDNRANHHYPTYQGSKSFVEILHDRRNPDGTSTSLIELFREKHSKKLADGTICIPDLALKQYEMMKNLLNEQ